MAVPGTYQWAETASTAVGRGTDRPTAPQASVNAFLARAFIGLPWPRKTAGIGLAKGDLPVDLLLSKRGRGALSTARRRIAFSGNLKSAGREVIVSGKTRRPRHEEDPDFLRGRPARL